MSFNVVECSYPACNCSFKSQESMLQHYTDTHSQPHHHKLPCCSDHCSKSFRTQQGLEDHLRVAHHLDQLTASAAAASVVDDLQQILAPALPLQPADPVGHVACNDCGRTFRTTDFLHQHQWDSADHTRVSKSRNPNNGSSLRTCSQCGDKFRSADRLEEHFMDQHPISEVSTTSEEGTWQHVAECFRTAWTKPSIKLYEVHRIFKVYNPGWRRKEFEEYRKILKQEMADHNILKEDDLELRNRVLRNGNELRRYHGTTVKCQLGGPPNATDMESPASSLCASTDCSMCRILQTGFKLSKCKVERFQRFGKGIYSSSISSKASAYVNCCSSGAQSRKKSCFDWSCFGISDDDDVNDGNYKVMMVCKVLAGRPYHSTSNLQHLKGPPSGFHSVQGDAGSVLNYDELVVYDDRAILPDFIILYSSSD